LANGRRGLFLVRIERGGPGMPLDRPACR
jgi:hypothetical protein